MRSSIKILKWRAYHLWLEWKMKRIRKKEKIRFLFILQELSQWKTEMLYVAMVEHPKFMPIIGVTKCHDNPGAEERVISYCKQKGYPYMWLDPEKSITEQVDVDILTHQKPYSNEIYRAHYIANNRSIPLICIPYYLSTITEEWIVNSKVSLLAWRQFCDNDDCREEWAKMSKLHGYNYAVTGLPMMDELLMPKDAFDDVWPVNDHRKRVIYAPHHTIADIHWKGIGYSTFLEYSQFMLEMRDKYKESVYFVFKPHPRLFVNLVRLWGEEAARSYYDAWQQPGISHLEVNEKYLSLFKHSDAMIHDCGSFTIEYLYTGNPVMYLIRDEHHKDNLTKTASQAFDLHYKGYSKEDIERFIQMVIAGNDPLAERRRDFADSCLRPPYGKSACENIIHAILGQEEFR